MRKYYLHPDVETISIRREGKEPLHRLLNVQSANPSLLKHAAVEIKTATALGTVNIAKAVSKVVRDILELDAEHSIFYAVMDSEVYCMLTPCAHLVKLRHHAAVLGIDHSMYEKSSSSGIIFIFFINYYHETLSEILQELVDIVSSSVSFLYKKGDSQVKYVQDGTIFTCTTRMGLPTHANSGALRTIIHQPMDLNALDKTRTWSARCMENVKQFVYVMGRQVTEIESSRGSNPSLSQFIPLRL